MVLHIYPNVHCYIIIIYSFVFSQLPLYQSEVQVGKDRLGVCMRMRMRLVVHVILEHLVWPGHGNLEHLRRGVRAAYEWAT